MLPPHGGRLVDRLVHEEKRPHIKREASELVTLPASTELRKDLENIAYGIFSPLTGPLTRNDYIYVLERGRLQDDLPWTFPITMDVSDEAASEIREGDDIALSHEGSPFATLHLISRFMSVKTSLPDTVMLKFSIFTMFIVIFNTL